MTAWRVIFTDSESETGVAPICDQPEVHGAQHGDGPNSPWVYDCCPHPHVECWSEQVALDLAQRLTEVDAKLCD